MKTILVDAAGTFTVDGVVDEKLHSLLEQYPNKKIIVTNANDEQMPKYGLINLPYELFTLKHNPDKVEPKYFETLLTQYNLKAEDVIYFEHSPEAVESAKSVGITSYHFDETMRDYDTLKAWLDANL